MGSEETLKALLGLINDHVDDLLSAAPEELLSEANELGVDIGAGRKRHCEIFERATMKAGVARLAGARAALDAHRAFQV